LSVGVFEGVAYPLYGVPRYGNEAK
jgi:hypothetical protein